MQFLASSQIQIHFFILSLACCVFAHLVPRDRLSIVSTSATNALQSSAVFMASTWHRTLDELQMEIGIHCIQVPLAFLSDFLPSSSTRMVSFSSSTAACKCKRLMFGMSQDSRKQCEPWLRWRKVFHAQTVRTKTSVKKNSSAPPAGAWLIELEHEWHNSA